MPYASVSGLPKHIKQYTPKIQRMWLKVFNNTWKQLTKKGVTGKEREARAFKSANGTIKRRMEKHGTNRYGHRTYFLMKMDSFLKNLESE